MVSIAFTGGGTGGHIYPGLAVAAALGKLLPCRIFWIGAAAGMDRSILEDAGLEFFGVPSGKLRRYFSLKNFSDIFKIGLGFLATRAILKREKPALLFSKGGFVSVPPVAAAASLGIPVFTHESDYSPGLATRINARFAERIFIAYQDTAAFFPPAQRSKLVVAGNPVRPGFHNADAEAGRAFLGVGPQERILLVLGGSQGAREINELVWESLPRLTQYYTVVHQIGPKAELPPPGKLNVPAERGIPEGRYLPYAYIREEMSQVLAAAELVLGRSGAGTVWESAVAGKPMVLIPLSGSGTRGDQVENAEFFKKAGAARVIQGGGDSSKIARGTSLQVVSLLAETVASLAEDAEGRNAMAAASRRLGDQDGALIIAQEILSRVKGEE
ncbi:undecaprenyldiphospho-muramoylpentapeptide beta-N-acetylglucosaminyltransferase [Treponema primitia ZAS-2]|uniref:UDP-N-acetylglucosamine--N-acetylmuramyl-(pentapeptide) pyrophosphoryl-undecaprenol N-acetylglucosamine transferase n=1 Tax=Treponema primitia (strain ATCC BAA-887 / DSM 12427 / ZAS-2) TaxID=545694 RepID=F5YII2_TREPZ|nr:undecaprenyldiphospho-muramoylpentapeptide beta-N-acetylglucosaminyltransferase [Treponema primitia]AEF86362.1 undecaprenyldiphospho-muramoylpentapeptide beta-N-acetylglucosaminyltransferase [Treponema primitia ZAS-2]